MSSTSQANCKDVLNNGNALHLGIMFCVAIVFLLVMSFVKRRNSFRKDLLRGRPGPVVPLDMLNDFGNRFGHALAFGVIAFHCIQFVISPVADSEIFGTTIASSLKKSRNYLKAIIMLMSACYFGVAAYPIFYCMKTRHRAVGRFFGAFFCILWFALLCQKYVNYKSCTGSTTNFDVHLIADMPQFICIALLIVKFVVALAKIFGKIISKQHDGFQKRYVYLYTSQLLRKELCDEKPTNEHWIMKQLHKIYKNEPYFRYSSQMISCFVVSVVALFQITLQSSSTIFLIFGPILETFGVSKTLYYGVFVTAIAYCSTSFLLAFLNMLKLYRKHVKKLRMGDRSWILLPQKDQTPANMISASMKYAGFQTGYCVVGYFVHLSLVFVLALGIVLLIIAIKRDTSLIVDLLAYCVVFLIPIILAYGQNFMAKHLFFQEKEGTLAIDNRKAFHITAYFMFFYNTFIGGIQCSLRLAKLQILVFLSLPRIQKPLFAAEFARHDPGYQAYIGYILVEHYHANPVMHVFLQLLQSSHPVQKDFSYGELQQYDIFGLEGDFCNFSPNTTSSKRARNRWNLAFMLMKNPSLKKYRNHKAETTVSIAESGEKDFTC